LGPGYHEAIACGFVCSASAVGTAQRHNLLETFHCAGLVIPVPPGFRGFIPAKTYFIGVMAVVEPNYQLRFLLRIAAHVLIPLIDDCRWFTRMTILATNKPYLIN
jgi:hypothetical protein